MGDRLRVCPFLLAAMLLAAGSAAAPAAAEELDTWTSVVEHRKDVVIARLGICESGASAHPDRSGYTGPYQFSTQTVIAYVREKYGEQSVAQIGTFGTLGDEGLLMLE